jgi:hypothetical protein
VLRRRYVVKYPTDGGATWNVLKKMGIVQNLGTPFKRRKSCFGCRLRPVRNAKAIEHLARVRRPEAKPA